MEGLEIIIVLILLIMFGPPLLFLVLGFVKRRSNPSASKVFFILAFAWIIIGGGICASMIV
jgi:quinol-cytochrome oxidoreductase complex cytochrome b subunit